MIKKFFAPFIAILECITKYFKAFVFLLIVAVLIFSTREPKRTQISLESTLKAR